MLLSLFGSDSLNVKRETVFIYMYRERGREGGREEGREAGGGREGGVKEEGGRREGGKEKQVDRQTD